MSTTQSNAARKSDFAQTNVHHHPCSQPDRPLIDQNNIANLALRPLCIGTSVLGQALQITHSTSGRAALRGFGAFLITADDAEVIALGIGKHHPARPVGVPTVGDLSGTQRNDALDLIVSASIAWGQVEVDASADLA